MLLGLFRRRKDLERNQKERRPRFVEYVCFYSGVYVGAVASVGLLVLFLSSDHWYEVTIKSWIIASLIAILPVALLIETILDFRIPERLLLDLCASLSTRRLILLIGGVVVSLVGTVVSGIGYAACFVVVSYLPISIGYRVGSCVVIPMFIFGLSPSLTLSILVKIFSARDMRLIAVPPDNSS